MRDKPQPPTNAGIRIVVGTVCTIGLAGLFRGGAGSVVGDASPFIFWTLVIGLGLSISES